jgi:hypothetical protein
MRRGLGACLVLAAMAGWGCGGGNDGENSTVGAVEITGESSADLKIGSALQRYLARNCGERGAITFAQFRRRALAPHEEIPPALVRRYIERRYGSLRDAYRVQTSTSGCRPVSISVSRGVITVATRYDRSRLGRIGARDVCNLIQGSDVADFTEGHRVLAADGTVLARCPPRTG